MFLILLGIAVSAPLAVAGEARAAKDHFKGPTATCLPQAKRVYSCISLSPPAYQSRLDAGTIAAVSPQLPLNTGTQGRGWLARLKDGDNWHTDWRLAQAYRDMKMDLTVQDTGAVVKMDLGPLSFNIYAEDGGLSESRLFLGIDRSW